MTAGVAFLFRTELGGATVGPLDVRNVPEGIRVIGFGVVLESPEGSFSLLAGRFIGVFIDCAVVEASEIGGDGGVGVSETVSLVEIDLVSGGVVIIGDEAVEAGEPSSNEGVLGAVMSVDIEGYCRFRSLFCIISASTFRSDSSSRRRCVSILRFSRSCSPTLISSSIMTALSIPILYFDSRSSSEEEVFRACRSKSSLDTSMSRSFSCNVRFESRSVVISFCKVFCTVPASFLACLYLVFRKS